MNWFVETRLSWIKENIEIFGQVNRHHICKKFGITQAQASLDLREARHRWPNLWTTTNQENVTFSERTLDMSRETILTIGPNSYTLPYKSFFYDGSLSSCPTWFIDFLEEIKYHRAVARDGRVLTLHNLPNGHITIDPNSIVFFRPTDAVVFAIPGATQCQSQMTEHITS